MSTMILTILRQKYPRLVQAYLEAGKEEREQLHITQRITSKEIVVVGDEL